MVVGATDDRVTDCDALLDRLAGWLSAQAPGHHVTDLAHVAFR